jgi:hypothetical protein
MPGSSASIFPCRGRDRQPRPTRTIPRRRALYGAIAGVPLAMGRRLSIRNSPSSRRAPYLGPDFGESWLAENGVEHRTVGNGSPGTSMELIPGVHVVNGFSRNHPEEPDNPRFVVDRGGVRSEKDLEVDDFRDEFRPRRWRRGRPVAFSAARTGGHDHCGPCSDHLRRQDPGRARVTHLMDATRRGRRHATATSIPSAAGGSHRPCLVAAPPRRRIKNEGDQLRAEVRAAPAL